MYPEDVDRQSRCRLPLPKREELSGAAAQIYDSLADRKAVRSAACAGPAASTSIAHSWRSTLARSITICGAKPASAGAFANSLSGEKLRALRRMQR